MRLLYVCSGLSRSLHSILIRFDYIARDVRAIGDHNNFSATRLIDSARVIEDEICYNIKDANSLYELCQLRFSNHKRIYSHKTARAIEFMLIDALKAAEPVMNIAKQIYDPKKYLFLTDNVKSRIEQSDDPRLAESRAILDRVANRDLYRCVDWYVGKFEQFRSFKDRITPDVIVDEAKRKYLDRESLDNACPAREDVQSLSREHVIVDISVIHYGMKEKNPLDFVRFYSKFMTGGERLTLSVCQPSDNIFAIECQIASPGELSTLVPACFAEFQLRVFTKDQRLVFSPSQALFALLLTYYF